MSSIDYFQGEVLAAFRSPSGETSIYKGIPVEKYSRQIMSEIRDRVGCSVRVRFRGPRKQDFGRSPETKRASCLRANAKTFTVYRNVR